LLLSMVHATMSFPAGPVRGGTRESRDVYCNSTTVKPVLTVRHPTGTFAGK